MTGKDRAISIAHFSIAIAILSLVSSGFQAWVNSRNLENVQHDIARREHIRACKEVIEAYFEVKARVGLVMGTDLRVADRTEPAGAEMRSAAAVAVARFAAIGTFLANFQDEAARAQYTALSLELTRILASARDAQTAGLEALFADADRLFARMNDDCVRSARAAPI